MLPCAISHGHPSVHKWSYRQKRGRGRGREQENHHHPPPLLFPPATKKKCNWRWHSFPSLQFHASPSHGTPLLFLFSLPLFGEKRRKRLFPFLRQESAELSIGGAASIYPPFSAFSSLSLSLSLSPLFLSFLSFRRHHVKGGRERKGRVRDFPVCPMQCTVLHHSMEGGAGRRERRWYY